MLALFCVATVFTFTRSLELPAFFSDGLVLQADADVAVWGHTAEGRVVTVSPSWANESIGVITSDWGSTAAESWTPANALAPFPHTHEPLARLRRAAGESGGVSEVIARQRAEWWERVDELDAGVGIQQHVV